MMEFDAEKGRRWKPLQVAIAAPDVLLLAAAFRE